MSAVVEWDSLSIVNAMIGFTRSGDLSWPAPLAYAGYGVWSLEQNIGTTAGQCVADLVLHSNTARTTLLVEAKCGALSPRQHACYLALRPDDLKDSAGVPNTSHEDYSADFGYGTSLVSAEKLLLGMAHHGSAPAVVFTDDQVYRSGDQPFNDPDLEALFGGGIDLTGCIPPMQYMSFDAESDATAVAKAVYPIIVSCLRKGTQWLHFDDFMEQVLPVWKMLGSEAQRGLRGRVKATLNSAPAEVKQHFETEFHALPHRVIFNTDLSTAGPGDMNRALMDLGSIVQKHLRALAARAGQTNIFELEEEPDSRDAPALRAVGLVRDTDLEQKALPPKGD